MNSELTVGEVVNREYVGVSESDDLVETVEVMLREEADAAVVLRGSEPVGVLTERDVLALLIEGPPPEEATVADAMTESVPTIPPDEPIHLATDRLSARSARRLVVTDGSEPMGIITERDLLATRTYDRSMTSEESEMQSIEASAETALASEAQTEADDTFENQGVCEACGKFTRDLAAFNGQLLCSDCRDM